MKKNTNAVTANSSTVTYLKVLFHHSLNGGTPSMSVEEVLENIAINEYGRTREEAKADVKTVMNLHDAVDILIERMAIHN